MEDKNYRQQKNPQQDESNQDIMDKTYGHAPKDQEIHDMPSENETTFRIGGTKLSAPTEDSWEVRKALILKKIEEMKYPELEIMFHSNETLEELTHYIEGI